MPRTATRSDARSDPVRSHPESVLSGRTLADVTGRFPDEMRALLRPEAMPDWQAPILATLTDKRFSDPRWIFELKFDGVRCLAFRDGDRLQLLSRNCQTLSDTYPELVDARHAAHVALRRRQRDRRLP